MAKNEACEAFGYSPIRPGVERRNGPIPPREMALGDGSNTPPHARTRTCARVLFSNNHRAESNVKKPARGGPGFGTENGLAQVGEQIIRVRSIALLARILVLDGRDDRGDFWARTQC